MRSAALRDLLGQRNLERIAARAQGGQLGAVPLVHDAPVVQQRDAIGPMLGDIERVRRQQDAAAAGIDLGASERSAR